LSVDPMPAAAVDIARLASPLTSSILIFSGPVVRSIHGSQAVPSAYVPPTHRCRVVQVELLALPKSSSIGDRIASDTGSRDIHRLGKGLDRSIPGPSDQSGKLTGYLAPVCLLS
jgi:hypothetical protein